MIELFNAIIGIGFIIILLMFALLITAYVLIGVFLTKFNKLVEGKGSALAWIPILNLYLLGKLLLNKGFGWVLLIAQIVIAVLTSSSTVTVGETTTSYSILNATTSTIITSVWAVICLSLLIWAIVKYFKIKKGSYTTQNTININSDLNSFLNQNINQTQIQNSNQNTSSNFNPNSNNLSQNTNQVPNQTNNWNSNNPNGTNL